MTVRLGTAELTYLMLYKVFKTFSSSSSYSTIDASVLKMMHYNFSQGPFYEEQAFTFDTLGTFCNNISVLFFKDRFECRALWYIYVLTNKQRKAAFHMNLICGTAYNISTYSTYHAFVAHACDKCFL